MSGNYLSSGKSNAHGGSQGWHQTHDPPSGGILPPKCGNSRYVFQHLDLQWTLEYGLVQEVLHLSFMCMPRPTSTSCSKCAPCVLSRSRPDRTAIKLERQDRSIYAESTGDATLFHSQHPEKQGGPCHTHSSVGVCFTVSGADETISLLIGGNSEIPTAWGGGEGEDH